MHGALPLFMAIAAATGASQQPPQKQSANPTYAYAQQAANTDYSQKPKPVYNPARYSSKKTEEKNQGK